MTDAFDKIRALSGVERVEPRKVKDAGTVGIITKHAPAVRTQLKQLALDLDKSQQDLVAEALNMLFSKYDRPPIA